MSNRHNASLQMCKMILIQKIVLILVTQDVLNAISKLPCGDLKTEGLPTNIQSLKIQTLRSRVEEVEKELNEKVTVLIL